MKTTYYELRTDTTIRFTEGSLVFRNGILQRRGSDHDYTKDSFKGTINFTADLNDSDVIAVVEE